MTYDTSSPEWYQPPDPEPSICEDCDISIPVGDEVNISMHGKQFTLCEGCDAQRARDEGY